MIPQSPAPHFAIFRAVKIRDWSALDRRIRHAERSGKTLPTNADPKRQHLNRNLFPDASGINHAKARWHERVGSATVRKNAVLAIELFLGASSGFQLSETQTNAWVNDNLAWVHANFGGENNIFAGGLNRDEKTMHLHVFVVPMYRPPTTAKRLSEYQKRIAAESQRRAEEATLRAQAAQPSLEPLQRIIPKKKLLASRHFLGGSTQRLSELQDSYAAQMSKYGLQRGLRGSKRKHIPQRTLYEFRNHIESTVQQVDKLLSDQLQRLPAFGVLDWNLNRQQIIQEVQQTFATAKAEIAHIAEVASNALLLRRDELERAQLVREKTEAQGLAAKEKQRADQTLKDQAALVRGLDLVPLATEILGLSPTEKDGSSSFTDAHTSLQITGRRFKDTLNPDCKGTGAIDLVCKLTNRNFKDAVEFLISRHSPSEIAADHAGAIRTQCHDYIQATDPKPRIITLEDVPKRIWQPQPSSWPHLLARLTTQHHLDRNLLLSLHQQNTLWAISPSTLAVARSPIPANNPTAAPVGVTLLDLDDPLLRPRILAPSQAGGFWLGAVFSQASQVVVTANPLEALSYRQLCTQFPNDIAAYSAPHIISADGPLPPPSLLQSIDPTRQRLILATHAPVSPDDLAHHHPAAAQDRRPADWLTILNAQPNVPEAEQAKAWNRKLIALTQFPPEKVLVRAR